MKAELTDGIGFKNMEVLKRLKENMMESKQFDNTKCWWTHNIADALECSPDGKFDDYGFAETNCPHKNECDKYQNEVKPQYKVKGIKER